MITPGRQTCTACNGNGGGFRDAWLRCIACDGIGHTWKPGGPKFGCPLTLGEREPGEIVILGSGERARIAWHAPRPAGKVKATTTFVHLFDDFDEEYELPNPVPVSSGIGVRSVATTKPHVDDDGTGHKNVDIIDPLNRQRKGALL
jgi:hypothetical protein